MILYSLVLVLSCTYPAFSIAQTTSPVFTNYSTVNGLCYGFVFDIIQDSRGYMWFGTAEGLSRFDGTNFKNFYVDKNDSVSFPSNQVSQLHEYKKGLLVFNSGLQLWCMNTITMQFFQPRQFKGKIIHEIGEDKKGHYFIMMADTSFITDDALQITDTIIPSAKIKSGIPKIRYLPGNKILVVTGKGVFVYNKNTKKYQPFSLPLNKIASDYELKIHLYDTVNNRLYYSGSGNGLCRFSFNDGILHRWQEGKGVSELSSGIITSFLQINDSTIWVGAGIEDGNGLNIINTNTNAVTQIEKNDKDLSSLINNMVRCIYKDAGGNIWLATNNGISKLNNFSAYFKSWHRQFDPEDLQKDLISITKGPDNNMYFSFYFGNTYRLNTRNNEVIKMSRDFANAPWSLYTQGTEIYRTGSGNAIISYDVRTAQYKKLDFLKSYYPAVELIVSGFTHSSGDKWYSANTGGGFVRVDAKDGTYHVYKKDGSYGNFTMSYYTYHAETADGDLWFGVNKTSRLLHWNKATDHFNEIEFENVAGTSTVHFSGINAVTRDSENNIWVGFEANGVVMYNPFTSTAVQYTMQDGLPTDHIKTLQFDSKNRLWIGTTNGLSCLLAGRKKIITFKKEDGLPEDRFRENCSYFDSVANKLWLGASATLVSFDPDVLVSINKKSFPVYLDGFFVNGKKYTPDSLQKTELVSSQNNLQFQFIAVDIANGKDIEYSYRLIGADKDWIYNGTITSASYANLNSGDYTFKVRARHKGDDVWTEINTPVEFTIATAWFKTWWFRSLLFVLAALLIWFIIRSYYLQKLEKQRMIIEKQQAVSSERSRIAADMHDDMGAGLSRIRYLSAAMKNQIKDEVLKKDLDKLITGSDELVDKMNDIIWTLNSGDETLEDVLYYIRSQCSEMLDHANINFQYSLPAAIPNKMVSSEEKRNLYLVVKEAVHNAIKHAHANTVGLTVLFTEKLKITVTDNGIGFDAAQNKLTGNGLSNYKKRMELLKGTVHIISDEKGTAISFELPL